MKTKNQVVIGHSASSHGQDTYSSPPPTSDLTQSLQNSSYATPAVRTVSIGIPAYYSVRLRKHWLVSMFILGVFSQYALAIYTPGVWNWFYEFLIKVLPVMAE